MSTKRSGSYSPMSASEAGEVISHGIVSLKTIVAFIGVLIAFVIVLAIAGFGLGIAGLGYKVVPASSTPPPTIKPPPVTQPSTSTTNSPPVFVDKKECGSGKWKRIGYFDMQDPTQQCPRGWRGYTDPVRCCGRPVTDRSSCPSVFYETDGYQYGKVCGMIIGFQQGSPDGFASIVNAEPDTETVNGIYVDGVSVTYGNPRTHIWTFAVGLHEFSTTGNPNVNAHNCPCDGGANPPPFVGNNYFCETGDDTPNVQLHRFYDDDPLWDGFDCHNTTCCLQNNPPWFNVTLSNPTTDPIEVRICGDQRTGDEDSPIRNLEIYVQ